MYYKISNSFDVSMLEREIDTLVSKISVDTSKIIHSIGEYIEILEEHYGQSNGTDSDGGVLLFFTSLVSKEELKNVLEHYHLKEDDAEFREVICADTKRKCQFVRELYVLTEYHVILMYPVVVQ